MKSEAEIRAEVERVRQILDEKAKAGGKADWDYYTFRKDALQWALGDYDE